MSMVAQAALLGAKDSVTPLLVTLGAGFVNFVLDIGLVSFGGLGIAGAALATVTAEIVGACVFYVFGGGMCALVCVGVWF
jgi:Na+-driven multidrug efflux pump